MPDCVERLNLVLRLWSGCLSAAKTIAHETRRGENTPGDDSLIDIAKRREQRAEQESLADARERAVRLSQLRYRGGIDRYLQVLDAETRLFDAQLQLADLKRDELTAIVQLYRALGGGWPSTRGPNALADR